MQKNAVSRKILFEIKTFILLLFSKPCCETLGTLCIRDLDKLNLTGWFNFRLEPNFCSWPKNIAHFKSRQKWTENKPLASFTSVKSKCLTHSVEWNYAGCKKYLDITFIFFIVVDGIRSQAHIRSRHLWQFSLNFTKVCTWIDFTNILNRKPKMTINNGKSHDFGQA